MNTIDYIYRFDPKNPSLKPSPPDAEGKESWGALAHTVPGYREALIDVAVCVNAAQAAFDLRLEVERAAKWEIEVMYGVFSLRNHQVSMPVDPQATIDPANVNLAYAPTNPREFNAIAVRMADLLKLADVKPNRTLENVANPE